jgi:hypothetical protein
VAYDDAPAAKKPKVPEGYEDIDEFLKEARERFEEAIDFDRENRDEAQTDLKFLAGEQWEPEDLAARKGLPCLTINQLPQFVAQVVGDIRINRPSIKARPAEDADKDLASIREGLIRAIEHDSKAQQVYANAGQSQVACGLGNFRVRLDYASEDVFERNIVIGDIPNPFSVAWDPARIEPTGADAGFCFVSEDIPRKVFEARYPNKVASDLGQDFITELSSSGWMSRDVVRISEYWVMKEKPAEIALLQDGSVKELTDQNRAELEPMAQTNSRGQPMIRKTMRKRACVYLITGHDLLEEAVEYPIDRIPVFRVPGWEVNTGEKTIRFGLVRFAKDAQRLKNFWRSVAAEKLALAPRQQWLIHESKTGDQEDFRDAANSGDTVLGWSGNIPPERLDPPPIEAALLQEAALNAQDMKDVTGLHDASLGARSNETSGKAILARQKEGDVASYIYHDNLKSAIAEAGRVINQLIPSTYDTARTIRVLGEDEQQKVMRVNDPNDPESVDLAEGKYDIVVETGPSYSTKRVEAAESMAQFFQVVPAAAQVAGDLFAKAMDWPLGEEIGERLKKTLPPGMVEDDKELSEEEMQARQQQAQQVEQQAQMQQQGVMLQMAELDAKVKLTLAQAEKMMAEAENVGAPMGEEIDPQSAQLDLMLKAAQVRKAEADADKAEAEAAKAIAELNAPAPMEVLPDPGLEAAQASQAEAKAMREHIGVQSDMMDLEAKPKDQDLAHQTTEKALKAPHPKPKAG